MPREIDDIHLQQLLADGLSQTEISRRTGIPRSTLRRRLNALSTPSPTSGVPQTKKARVQKVHPGTQQPDELIIMMDDLQEVIAWWQLRKHALLTEQDAEQETQRQTYHVQKRYIEAIKRAADLEQVSIAEIVNRAFKQFFQRTET